MAARRALLPGLAFSASGGLPGSFSTQIGTNWDSDITGSLRNSRRKAEAALAQSEAYRHSVQTDLVASIANSYYMLLMLDEQLNISNRTLKTWDENIRAMEALKRAGKTNEAKADYLRRLEDAGSSDGNGSLQFRTQYASFGFTGNGV